MPLITPDARPISLSDALAIPDILDAVRYTLYFGQIPGSGNTNHLTVKAFNASVPGESNESFDTFMGGHNRNFRGKRVFSNPLSVSFYEDSLSQTMTDLRTWHQNIAGTESGNSNGYLADYSVDAMLTVFDTAGRATATHIIHQAYLMDLNEIPLSAESSAAVQVTAQIKYSYMTSNTAPML